MSMVHRKVNLLEKKKKSKKPLEKISSEISKNYKLICFDELEIIDIADAMIVSKLFKALLEKNICFIITSNFIPKDLYKNGLQKSVYSIYKIIETKMCLVKINNNLDLRAKEKKYLKNIFYNYPLNKNSHYAFYNILASLQKNYKFKTTSIKSLGRNLVFDRTLNKIVVADFKFICSYKFSPNDYIAMAEAFRLVFYR